MLNTEDFLRKILGPVRSDIRPLILAVEHTMELLYHEQRRENDIRVSRDVYAHVAKQLDKKERTVAKAVQRLTSVLWDAFDQELVLQVIGKKLAYPPEPRAMLFYLAFYLYHEEAYHSADNRNPFEPMVSF